MNNVIISGRLTKDPDIRYTSSQMCVANFTLAVDRWGNKGTDFIRCVAFNKTAEFIEKNGFKGQSVTVRGRLTVDSYEDKDGNKRTETKVNCEEYEPHTWKPKEEKPKEEDQYGFEDFDTTDEPLPF